MNNLFDSSGKNATEISDITNQLNIQTGNVKTYGIRRNETTDIVTRLGNSVGLTANIAGAGVNDFDNIMPWAGMRRCNLDDNLNVLAYYGDANYKEDGSNGQVMVEVPAFYYKRERVAPTLDTIDNYISMQPLTGYKRSPWHFDALGNTVNKRYFSAYEGSIFDVSENATEVDTITVTAGCTTSGNVTITLDRFNIFNVAVVAGDTINQVATKIRNAIYSGWTTSGADPNVIFTCNTTGAKATAIVTPNATAVTASVVKTTTGAGGYIGLDAQIADFTAITGDKLCSIAGVKPCSGKTQALHIANSRKLANNRGSAWQQQYFNAVSMIQMLMTVEYASFNSQSFIGKGVSELPDTPNNENNSVLTGATMSLGNLSGRATGTNGLVSVSYRGIENFWGNIYKWVDGLNINNSRSFISQVNGAFISDVFVNNYSDVNQNPIINGYMSKTGLNANFDYGYLPSEATGTSNSKYSDYLYQIAVGAFVGQLGGYWGNGVNAGAFFWSLDYGSGNYARYVGARLCV